MMNEKRSYLKKLLKGEIPLVIVFWLWFIAFSFLLEIILGIEFIESTFVNTYYKEFFLYFLIFVYSILIFTIVYKSANKYEGSKIWSFFAKVLVSINLFFSLTFFIDIVRSHFFEDYAIEKEIEQFKENLPIQVDSTSVLIDIYKKDKTIFYNYQLFEVYLEKTSDRNKFKKQIQDSLCEDESSLDLLKKGYILDYEYINEKEEKVINIKTTKENCGKSIYDLEILSNILKKQGMF
jgi:hypothetical protein